MIEPDRLLTNTAQGLDEPFDRALRPRTLKEYIGQEEVRQQLAVFIQAARQRGDALDHVLLFGPPGLGKTTLAAIIANELAVNLRTTSGPILEKTGDLAAILTNLSARDVLFIDEIHRLSPVIEEMLYPAMEDQQLDIMIGEGPAARSIKLALAPFTLIGATTRAGALTSPLRDRFGIIQRLTFYSVDALQQIIQRNAQLLQLPLSSCGALEIARRSRGTPRIANRLLRRIRDYREVWGEEQVNGNLADRALTQLAVDQAGLDGIDRQLLSTLIEQFTGGPVGLESLATAIGESPDTVEEVVEPYLIQQGYIHRTPRGRLATALAYHHFGLSKPLPL